MHERIVRMAGVLNSHEVTARVTGDPRYAAGKNGKPPRKVGSMLVLLDCLSCDKCVPVCPNDAMFSIETPLEEVHYEDVVVDAAGGVARVPGGAWTVTKAQQWANFADACNECGNCDVFCPEDGGPYVMKARYFGSRASFDASPGLDGVWLERCGGDGGGGAGGDGGGGDGGDSRAALRVHARVGGRPCRLELRDGRAFVEDDIVRVHHDARTGAIVSTEVIGRGPHKLSGALFLTLRMLVRGALDHTRVNAVSAALPDVAWPTSID